MKRISAFYSKAIAAIVISSLLYNTGSAQVKQQFAAYTSYHANRPAQLSASINNGAISITWPSAFSSNDFTIERSLDGNEFKTVCYVFGMEQSEAIETLGRYNDRSIDLNGKHKAYYRIRQEDKNGNASYTESTTVNLK